MKKAAIKVSANSFQEMLKLPFGVAIEDVFYDKTEEEFTVVVFGERMPDEAEMVGNSVPVAEYMVSPLWHKGKITLTNETIEWPIKNIDSGFDTPNAPEVPIVKDEIQTPPESKEGESEVKENGKESKGGKKGKQQKLTRGRKA